MDKGKGKGKGSGKIKLDEERLVISVPSLCIRGVC